jgi:peptidoglycan hydrolase FlgJ
MCLGLAMNTNPLDKQNYFDLGDLNSLRQDALKSGGDKQASDQALKKAAQQFESIFTQMLLKSMRKANEAMEDKNSPFNSSGVKFFEEMHDQQLSMDLSSKGSLGLADLIVQQLSPTKDGYKPASVLRNDSNFSPVETQPQATNKIDDKVDLTHSINKDTSEQNTFDSPESFVTSIWQHAKNAAQKIGLNPAVMVAQAALETGWGKHIINQSDGSSTHNLFNIKANKDWQGGSAKKLTLEFEQGLPVKKQANFRVYESIKESMNDYIDFLQNNERYSEALKQVDKPQGFLKALQNAGYATDPNYASKIQSVLNRSEFKQILSSLAHRGVK